MLAAVNMPKTFFLRVCVCEISELFMNHLMLKFGVPCTLLDT